MHVASLLFLVAALNPLQSPAVKIGDPAPAFGKTAWLQGEAVTEFKPGTVYVLEFWATWCGSCVAAFPHLNEVAKSSADKKVVFISVTDEEPDRVTKFLKSHPLETRIAIDQTGNLFSRYGVSVLPRTVVVDGTGKVAAITEPANLNTAVIDSFCAGKPSELPVAGNKRADLGWDRDLFSAPGTVAGLLLQESDAASGAIQFEKGSGHITADGVCVGNLIQVAYGATPEEVVNSWSGYLKGSYRVSVYVPDGNDANAREVLKSYLGLTFPFKAEWSEVDAQVPVIRLAGNEPGPSFQPSKETKADGYASHGKIAMKRVDVKVLLKLLGQFVYGKPGVDETGLTGPYDIDFDWVDGDEASIAEALKKCGLTCTMETRRVRRLVVTPT